jgi:hypothetical protein
MFVAMLLTGWARDIDPSATQLHRSARQTEAIRPP